MVNLFLNALIRTKCFFEQIGSRQKDENLVCTHVPFRIIYWPKGHFSRAFSSDHTFDSYKDLICYYIASWKILNCTAMACQVSSRKAHVWSILGFFIFRESLCSLWNLIRLWDEFLSEIPLEIVWNLGGNPISGCVDL